MLDTRLQQTDLESVLAFDFGTKKMGVASGQKITGTGTPVAHLQMKDGVPDWPEIISLITQYHPAGCLVGLPLNMDSTESELCHRARKFARRLRHQVQLPVWMIDERLTTRNARDIKQIMKATASADSIAAALLIEQWYQQAQPILP